MATSIAGLKYGFYNNASGDDPPHVYDANDFSRMFDGVITDGVFSTYGESLMVTAVTDPPGMYVDVGTGRAWFNHTWTYNPTKETLDISPAEYNRVDAIVLEVDEINRTNRIFVQEGARTVSWDQRSSLLTNSAGVHQYPLAYIKVDARSASIKPSDITNCIGTDACPIVASAVQTLSVSELLTQWQDQFDTWFDEMKDQLSEDAAGNLQNQIGNLNEMVLIPEESRSSLSSAAKYLSEQVFPEDGPFSASKDSGPAEFLGSGSVSIGPNVAMLEIRFRVSGSQSAGANLMTGHINDPKFYPSADTYGISYYGSSIQVLYINQHGNFVIRNLASSMPSGTLVSSISATYICAL